MDTTTIRVLRETWEGLLQIQLELEVRSKRRLSMEDVIKQLVAKYEAGC